MKSCLRVPRVILPQRGFETWAVIAPDAFDWAYWKKVVSQVGDEPSVLGFLLPEPFWEAAGENAPERLARQMYSALEAGQLEKLNRGFVLTVRQTPAGERKGIIASVDLEEFSCIDGESAPIHSAQEADFAKAERLLSVRRATPLEFPHAVLVYRDKRDKIVRGLEKEDLEQIYDFELMLGGGRITGYFIPDYMAVEVAQALRSKAEPNFAVLDGEESLAAAKAHWQQLKAGLTEEEQRNHPARFALVELVNLDSEAVSLAPVHRLVEGVDTEAFCDYFMREMPCKRNGNVLYPKDAEIAEAARKTDALIARFVRANTGTLRYIHGEEALLKGAEEDGCAGVALKGIGKEELFPALKGGRVLPKVFSLGDDAEKRYCLEGREISYD